MADESWNADMVGGVPVAGGTFAAGARREQALKKSSWRAAVRTGAMPAHRRILLYRKRESGRRRARRPEAAFVHTYKPFKQHKWFKPQNAAEASPSHAGFHAGGVDLLDRVRDGARTAKSRITRRPRFSSRASSARSSTRVAGHRHRNPCTVQITRPVKMAAKMTSDKKCPPANIRIDAKAMPYSPVPASAT